MDKEQCISCGRDDRPLVNTQGAFLPDQYKICVVCAGKYNPIGVAGEADRLMAEVKIEPNHACIECGDTVIVKGDAVPMYCDECAGTIYAKFKEFLNV